jgi:MFS family permease
MVGLGIFSPLVKFFEDAYAISHAQMGTILAVSSVLGALGSFVGGAMYDRFGARLTISLATGLLACSAAGLFGAHTVLLFVVAVFLFRFSVAGGNIINVVVARLYPSETTRAIALFHGFKGAGNLIAPLAVAASVSLAGDWRPVLLVSAAFWFVWTLIFSLTLDDGLASNSVSSAQPRKASTRVRQLLDAKLAVGLFAFAFLPGSEGTIRTWITVFLMSEAAFSEAEALLALSIIMTGYTITRLLLGLVLHGEKRRVILPAVVLMVISFFVVVNAQSLILTYVFSLLLGASFAPYWPALVGALYDYVPADEHGVLTGLFSVFGMAGAFLSSEIVGSLGEAYSLKTALLVAPVCAVAYGVAYHVFSFFGGGRTRAPAETG